MRLILASASPRRRELLAAASVVVDVDPVGVDESRLDAETPAVYVERVARLKADAGAARQPGAVVIGADTAVVLGDEVFGKPRDTADAAAMLRRLSGRTHEVLTGVALVSPTSRRSFVERTAVVMRALSDQEIEQYVASGEPLDKAGAYAIQGGAASFIVEIRGSYSNVVGLPVERLLDEIRSLDNQ
jgi:septum formation protein